jgi:hypothetical protein
MSWVWTAGSLLALLLTAIVILLMPLTEYFWDFDKFLRGGQDFELGLLFIGTILCLAMVLLQHGKCAVNLSLSMRKWLSFVFRRDDRLASGSFIGLAASRYAIAVPCPALSRYRLPLQI